jgi:DNA-binding CsgD family transcriptional regulator
VIRINAGAERLLCREFEIRRNELRVADRTASDQIARALAGVSDNCEPRMLGPLSVRRQSRHPIILRFIRIDRIDANPFSQATVVVLLTDAEQNGPCPDNEIFRVFGLTAAEIHLARILSSGEDLAHAAARLHITSETARSRLKLIFAKTGTHKQGALVALLSRIGRTI